MVIVIRDRDLAKITPATESATGALIPNTTSVPSATPRPRPPRPRPHAHDEIETRLKEKCLEAYAIMTRLRTGMELGTREDVEQWILLARTLIEEFKSVKAFFPSEKGKRITWFDPEEDGEKVERRGRKPKKGDIETRVEELQTRLAGGEEEREESIERRPMP